MLKSVLEPTNRGWNDLTVSIWHSYLKVLIFKTKVIIAVLYNTEIRLISVELFKEWFTSL